MKSLLWDVSSTASSNMWVGEPQNTQNDGTTLCTAHVPCSEDVRLFILLHRKPQLRAIERMTGLRRFCITIDEGRARGSIFVTGMSEGLESASEMVQALVDKVVSDSFEIVQPGICTFCAKGKLDNLLRIVNSEEKRYVRVEKKFLQVLPFTSTINGQAVTTAGSPLTSSTASPATGVGNSNASTSKDSSLVSVTPQGHQISWKVGDIVTEKVRLYSFK